MSLRELYQEIIVEHAKHPRNFRDLNASTHQKEGHNPLCGDHLSLKLNIEHGVITDVAFTGSGCAIFMASSSLMTESIKGKSNEEAMFIFQKMQALLIDHKEDESLGKLAIFSGVHEFPIRVKCASLAWRTLEALLMQKQEAVTTE